MVNLVKIRKVNHRNSCRCDGTLVLVTGEVLRKVEDFDFEIGNSLLRGRRRRSGPLSLD